MYKFFFLFLSAFFWGPLFSSGSLVLASGEAPLPLLENGVSQVQVSPRGGSFALGQKVTLTAPEGMRIFWTLHPKRALEAGKVSDGNTVSFYLSRSVHLGVYAWDANGKETPMEIIPFQIESPYVNEYFRFHAIDPNPSENFVSTVTLENASQFSMSLDGWKIVSKDGSDVEALPDEEMEAGEIRRFVFPLSPTSGSVYLESPEGVRKDMVIYERLSPRYFLQRLPQQGRLDKRPGFEKVRHASE